MDVDHYVSQLAARIDTTIDRLMPAESVRPSILHKAMRYSVFPGGKRIRPVLCVAAAEACSVPLSDMPESSRNQLLTAASALEILHSYTLVHDDLPCMDDDAIRRGKPTVHVEFGEANAVLTGDALQALAFDWIAQASPGPRHSPGILVRELALAAGSLGVIGGQVEDLAPETRELTADTLRFIHQHKTADLFKASMRIGALIANADEQALRALTLYGESIGLTFQIIDDILDAPEGTPSDSLKELNCLRIHDRPTAIAQARELTRTAVAALGIFAPSRREPLAGIANRLMERVA